MSTGRREQLVYELDRLYEDQDSNYALETIPHVLAWLGSEDATGSFRFQLREHTSAGVTDHALTVAWDLTRLARRDPRLITDLQRFRSRRTLTLEDQPKYAAYGLALVAISMLLRRRVVDISYFRAPDLLLDGSKPGALRGVEVAGRGRNGYAAIAQAIEGYGGKPGKRAKLVAMTDVGEAYLSLWCREPEVAVWEKVKP